MAGTPDVDTNFESKTELDFRNRLVAKFAIPCANHFWNTGFAATPKTALYPPNDRVEAICREVRTRTRDMRASTDHIGQLIVEWAKFEERILSRARRLTERNVSVREAINVLRGRGQLAPETARRLNQLRRVRNTAAHTPDRVRPEDVERAVQGLAELWSQIGESLD